MKNCFKKNILLLLLILGVFSGCFASKVIIFSGTSTSGKTQVCRELMKALPNAIDVHFDDYFIDVVTQNYPKEKLAVPDLYGFVRKTSEKVREKIRDSLGKYEYIVCDTCVIDQVDMLACKDACFGHDCYFVLIYCPFAELASRVAKRNEKAKINSTPEDQRCQESVLWEFSNTYQGCCCDIKKSSTNYVFESSSLVNFLYDEQESLLERTTVKKIVPKNFCNDWLDVLLQGKTLEQEILEKMLLCEQECVTVEPKLPFDLVVDNGVHGTPQKCAQKIEEFLEIGGMRRTQTNDCFATKISCLLCDAFVPVSRFWAAMVGR